MPGTTLNALPLLNFTPTLEVDPIIIPHLIDDKPEAEGLGNSLQVSLDQLLRSQGAALGPQQGSLAGDPALGRLSLALSFAGYAAHSRSPCTVLCDPHAAVLEAARLPTHSGSHKSGGKCGVPVKFRLPCIVLLFRLFVAGFFFSPYLCSSGWCRQAPGFPLFKKFWM